VEDGASFDVEATFLNLKLDEPIYIQLPEYYDEYCQAQGIDLPKDCNCLKVTMSQYGMVQAAKNWERNLSQS
jgi:hypothetical protein